MGALAGLFFAVHPAHVEPVAFIAARVDTLLAFFGLASILAALAARRARGPLRLVWRGLACAAVAGALFSKESGAIVPILAFLCLAWDAHRDGAPWRTAIVTGLRESAATFVVLAVYLMGRTLLPVSISWSDWAQGASLWQRLITGIYLAGCVLSLTTIGFPWQPLYELSFIGRIDLGVVLSAMTLAGLGWVIWRGVARAELAALGGLWVIAAIFPVLNVIPMPSVRPVYFAERFAYLPSVGAALGLGHLGVAFLATLDGQRRRQAQAIMVAGLVAFGVVTALRSETWRDDHQLNLAILERNPRSPVALANLALVALRRGRPDEAVMLSGQVLAQFPSHRLALTTMGQAYLVLGRTDEGLVYSMKAVKHYPTDPWSLTNLGAGLIQAKRGREAIPYLQRALAADPLFPPALKNLGVARALEGDVNEGIGLLRKAQALRSDLAEPRILIGRILLEAGRPAEALVEFEEALRLDALSPVATWAMASTLDRLGRRTEARIIWERLRDLPGAEWYRQMVQERLR